MIFRIYHSEYRVDIIDHANEFEAICYLLSQPPQYSSYNHYLIKPQVKYKDIDRITGLWDTEKTNILGDSRLVFIDKPVSMPKDLNTIITPHMRKVTLEHNRQMAEITRTRLDHKVMTMKLPDPVYNPLNKTQWNEKQVKDNNRFLKAVDTFIGKIK